MYEFTVTMALVDFVPVAFFAVAGVLMMKDFHSKMSAFVFSTFSAGVINVFCAGFLKAIWKLLYAANICDFHALNDLFLPMQSIGFMLAGSLSVHPY